MEHLLLKITENINKIGITLDKKRILVAVSGGPDSVFLAYVLWKMGVSIGLAHVNYQLRGNDSDEDEQLVRQYAAQWSVPVHVSLCPTRKKLKESRESLQVFARNWRYQFFEELMEQEDYAYCAMAHHQDDEVETVLMNLLKSHNLAVLQGIPVQRDRYFRPLWNLTKEEIVLALHENELVYRVDESNQKPDYLRNRIRGEVLPLLSELNPSASQQILNRTVWYQLQHRALKALLDPWMPEPLDREKTASLDWNPFVREYGKDLKDVWIMYALEKWGIRGVQAEEVLKLKDSISGKWVEIGEGRIYRTRKGLMWEPVRVGEAKEWVINTFTGTKSINLGTMTLHLEMPFDGRPDFSDRHIFYLDTRKFSFPLVVRSWKKGDRMIPLGMRNSKKLSDIFIDEKYEESAKHQAWVIETEGKIIALSGFRISEQVKWEPSTKAILKMSFESLV